VQEQVEYINRPGDFLKVQNAIAVGVQIIWMFTGSAMQEFQEKPGGFALSLNKSSRRPAVFGNMSGY
jgi:hypothetical protein